MARTRKMKMSAKGTRKGKRAASPWNKLVMKVYAELKKKNKDTKLGDAMSEAARRKREGQA